MGVEVIEEEGSEGARQGVEKLEQVLEWMLGFRWYKNLEIGSDSGCSK